MPIAFTSRYGRASADALFRPKRSCIEGVPDSLNGKSVETWRLSLRNWLVEADLHVNFPEPDEVARCQTGLLTANSPSIHIRAVLTTEITNAQAILVGQKLAVVSADEGALAS